MKTLTLIALCALTGLLRGEDSFKKSVVKVFTTAQNIDYYEPWKSGSQFQMTGAGTIVSGQRILTTAHLVNKGNFIEVQKFGGTRRFVAKVEQLGFDLDLALLSVEDPAFFEDTKAVSFGEIPVRGDKLLIQGGEEQSIKEDSVSAMNLVYGDEGGRYMPAIITNGAIEPSNNGCPVFSGGKFVGIPFDSTGKPDKTGSLIPVHVIQRFFKGLEGGRSYSAFPDLGFETQDLKNPSLRNFYKIPAKLSGEVIAKIIYGGSADGVLKEGDVLTAVDGNPVDDEGYVTLKRAGRVPEAYLATFYLEGEPISLDILRDGKALQLKMPLKPLVRLLPMRNDNRHPSYLVMGGFVFVPLTVNYFSTGSWDGFKPELQELYFHGLPSEHQKQVVLISHVLPHEANQGYERVSNVIVNRVNGQPISEMKDLLTAFEKPQGKNHLIYIDDHEWFGSTIVMDVEKSRQATVEIMKTFKIPSEYSADLK